MPNPSRIKDSHTTRVTIAHDRRVRLAVCLLIVLLLALCWWGLPWLYTLPPNLLNPAPNSTRCWDRNGTLLVDFVGENAYRRRNLSQADLNSTLIQCVLAAEDHRFFQHRGIDFIATLRALWQGGRTGASTITQQVIKIHSSAAPRDLATKWREIMLARQLEMRWDKQQILLAYLNQLDFGNRSQGLAQAALRYFRSEVTQLSLAQMSLLVALPRAPSRLNPLRHPDLALRRRNWILNRQQRMGWISEERAQLALNEPLQLREMHLQQPPAWLKATMNAGSDLHCTIDAEIQKLCEKILDQELMPLRQKNAQCAAVIVANPRHGEILALAARSSRDQGFAQNWNIFQMPRSAGSTLKPFTYMLAFEHQLSTPATILADIPSFYQTSEGLDAPENYDKRFRGPVSVTTALASSLNVPAMRQLQALGGASVLLDYLKLCGFQHCHERAGDYGLGLTIGNAPVTLMELVEAYTCLANDGMRQPLHWLKSTVPPAQRRVASPTSAWLIRDILANPAARTEGFARGGPLELPFYCAAKTGTSSNYRDNWCVGLISDWIVGVWLGNLDQRPMQNVSGVTGAGPIFRQIIIELEKRLPSLAPNRPADIVHCCIDPRTGKILAQPSSTGQWVHCPRNSLPAPAEPSDYDPQKRAYLDAIYTPWLRSEQNSRRNECAERVDSPSQTQLCALIPARDATFYLDPELPNGKYLRLISNLPQFAEWSCDSLEIKVDPMVPAVVLQAGQHCLKLRDKRDGTIKEIRIRVIKL